VSQNGRMRTYGSGNFWPSHGSLYYRIWVDGVRFQFNLGKVADFPTLKSREAAAREKLATLPVSSPRNQRNVTLAEFIERTYLPYAKETVRNSTYAEYKGMFERHLKSRTNKPIRHYQTPQVQDLLDAVADAKISVTSMRHVRALVSGIFRFAKKRGLYSGENPVRDCTLPFGLKPPRTTSAYTLAQINSVLEKIDDPETKAIVAVAAFAGLRRSEIQGLRFCDWDGDQLHVRQSVFNYVVNEPKSHASRNWVPVMPVLKDILTTYFEHRKAEDQFGLLTPDSRMFR
jgi:integrase